MKERVGAVIAAYPETSTILLLGYGELDEIKFGDPKIILDNGDIVYGSQCWWGSEERIKVWVSAFDNVRNVRVGDYFASST